MTRFLITYKKKENQQAMAGAMSTQLIDAKSRQEIFVKLCERLHVKEEQFKERFDVVEILEV